MVVEVIVLLLAVPTGFLIAYWANDELVQGRKWFSVLMVLALVFGAWFLVKKDFVLAEFFGFVFIVSLISYRKSFDKKWVKKRI